MKRNSSMVVICGNKSGTITKAVQMGKRKQFERSRRGERLVNLAILVNFLARLLYSYLLNKVRAEK